MVFSVDGDKVIDFFFFFLEKQTHTRKRDRGSNTKTHYKSFTRRQMITLNLVNYK